jgi:flagellum-specific ATP synthase
MDEPVADITRGVLDGHVILDREIAERGRFPAVDVRRSVSRSLPAAATVPENAMISEARRIISTYENNAPMIHAGLYQAGTDPGIDEAIKLWPKLDNFFTQKVHGGVRESFDLLNFALS